MASRKKVPIDIADDAVEPDSIEVEEAADKAASGSNGEDTPKAGAAERHEGGDGKDKGKGAEGADAQEEPEGNGPKADDRDAELAAAKAQALEMVDKYTRLQAEWDNYRKRNTAERADERNRANERLVRDLLPVMDDFERAIEHAKGDATDMAGLLGGIEAVHTKLLGVLGKHQVSQIDPKGQPFDALTHQAVSKVEDDSVPDETVAQVFQMGYEMAGKVIRPAMVAVSCGGPVRPKEAEAEAEAKAEDAGDKACGCDADDSSGAGSANGASDAGKASEGGACKDGEDR